jgi:hypothetical protein
MDDIQKHIKNMVDKIENNIAHQRYNISVRNNYYYGFNTLHPTLVHCDILDDLNSIIDEFKSNNLKLEISFVPRLDDEYSYTVIIRLDNEVFDSFDVSYMNSILSEYSLELFMRAVDRILSNKNKIIAEAQKKKLINQFTNTEPLKKRKTVL